MSYDIVVRAVDKSDIPSETLENLNKGIYVERYDNQLEDLNLTGYWSIHHRRAMMTFRTLPPKALFNDEGRFIDDGVFLATKEQLITLADGIINIDYKDMEIPDIIHQEVKWLLEFVSDNDKPETVFLVHCG